MTAALVEADAACCHRRAFLGWCAVAAFGSAVTSCAALVVRPITPVDDRIELAFTHYPELREPGAALKLQLAGTEELLYVLALEDGSFAALSPI